MGNPVLDDIDEERAALVPEADPAEAYVADPVIAEEPALVAPRPALQAHGAPVAPLGIPGYSERADQGALDAAVRDRSAKDAEAHFADAGAFFRHAFNGAPGNGDAIRKTRDDSFQDVMRQRATEDRDRVLAKEQHSAALEAALARGDSPESVAAKEAFGNTIVGRALFEKMGPEAVQRLPGSAVPGAKDRLASDTELMKSQLRAQGAAKGSDKGDYLDAFVKAQTADPAEQASLRARFQGISPDAIQHIVLPSTTNQGNHSFSAAQQTTALSHSDVAREDTQAHEDAKIRAQRQVGGYHLANPDAIPNEHQATKFNDLVAQTKSVLSGLDAVKDEYAHMGLGGKLLNMVVDGPMAQTLTSIRVKAKELFNLGVLNGKDYELLSRTIPDPNTLSGLALPKNMDQRMETAKGIFQKSISDWGQAAGYVPDAASAAVGAPATPAPNAAPALPTAKPVREPGGASAPVGAKPSADPRTQIAAAKAWLADPKNTKSPKRATVIQSLQALGAVPK